MEVTARSPSARPAGTLTLPDGRTLSWGRTPRVMGILNLTPDSFSDGGLWREPEHAVAGALEMLDRGADVIDLGAESTRPGGGVYGDGARTVPAPEELDRLLPVLRPLRRATDAPISVDTRKGSVAAAVLAEGADLINDVAALEDPAMGRAVAEAGCPVVLMHSRGELATMQERIAFDDVVAEVRRELGRAVERARTAGVADEQIVVDPGIGFGKTGAQNLALLRHLPALADLGFPLLVGASRKSFIGEITAAPADRRLAGSLAAAAWAADAGVALLRVHDVEETARFLKVWAAIAESADGRLRPSPEGACRAPEEVPKC
ncbi:MAG: dihydropteroate synthase [Acidobacteriota bacterium]